MKFRFFIASSLMALSAFVTGCSKSEDQVRAEVAAEAASKASAEAAAKAASISFQTLEDNRNTARENALTNAQAYRAENPRFDEGFKIVTHGDSTQSPECPQGDGWATVSIMKVKNKEAEKYKVKCSTVSAALGCYLEDDFTKKPFAREEGKCQPTNKVPFPLPKIGT